MGNWFLAAHGPEDVGRHVGHEVVEQSGRARLAAAVDHVDLLVGQHQAFVLVLDGRVGPGADVAGEDPGHRPPRQVEVVDLAPRRVRDVVHDRYRTGDVRHVLVAPGRLTPRLQGRELGLGAGEVDEVLPVGGETLRRPGRQVVDLETRRLAVGHPLLHGQGHVRRARAVDRRRRGLRRAGGHAEDHGGDHDEGQAEAGRARPTPNRRAIIRSAPRRRPASARPTGWWNMWSVVPFSTRNPGWFSSARKKAHWSDTRWACCMLWVTITTVTSSRSSAMVSSTRRVEVGSRAEQGSSISSTLGCTASDRAMHSRCCWPPERPPPGLSSRSRTSRQRLARTSDSSTSVSLSSHLMRASLRPDSTFSRMLMAGNGFGFWNTMPMRVRTCLGPPARLVDVLAVEQDLAVEGGPGDELVHAVEQPQEGRLAAARRADERGHLPGGHDQVDALEHEVIAEPGAGVARLERGRTGWGATDELGPARRGRGRAAVRAAGVEGRRRDRSWGGLS